MLVIKQVNLTLTYYYVNIVTSMETNSEKWAVPSGLNRTVNPKHLQPTEHHRASENSTGSDVSMECVFVWHLQLSLLLPAERSVSL